MSVYQTSAVACVNAQHVQPEHWSARFCSLYAAAHFSGEREDVLPARQTDGRQHGEQGEGTLPDAEIEWLEGKTKCTTRFKIILTKILSSYLERKQTNLHGCTKQASPPTTPFPSPENGCPLSECQQRDLGVRVHRVAVTLDMARGRSPSRH